MNAMCAVGKRLRPEAVSLTLEPPTPPLPPLRRWGPVAMLAAVLGLASTAAEAVDWTGRISLLGSASHPSRGDVGDGAPGTPTADQQSLRLMAQDQDDDAEWSVHLKASRQNLRGNLGSGAHASALFRWRRLADAHSSGDGVTRSTRVSWEIDRAVYMLRFDKATLSLGRQPVDFGSGRFWQPLNVFGAFAPTDLDTDFKPGIDAAVLTVYPSAFSSLTAVVALSPHHQTAINNSAALHYQRQIGETSQLAVQASHVVGQQQVGASFESDWRGIGWRIEGLHMRPEGGGPAALFWVLGADYQFDNGTSVTLEWHDDARGATREAALSGVAATRPVTLGLQQQLARRVLGLSLQKDLTPLWSSGYTLLATSLPAVDGSRTPSRLHQISLVRSLGNESDLLLALSIGTGKGLGPTGTLRSSFGHLPATLTVRWRMYF